MCFFSFYGPRKNKNLFMTQHERQWNTEEAIPEFLIASLVDICKIAVFATRVLEPLKF